MTDGDTLLRSIRENPHDDTPRLVYADWLDEHGDDSDAEHAELIRAQVELTKCRPDCGTGKVCRGVGQQFGCVTCAGVRDRTRELLAAVEPVVRRGERC